MVQPLRTLSRGLEVLRVLNCHDGSPLGLIAKATALSRGSVHRLLETMVSEGYVRKTEGYYFVERKARALTASLEVSDWIGLETQDAIDELCRQTLWPISILRPNHYYMETWAGTERLTPLRYNLLPIGTRVSMMCSASGRAYMAFNPLTFQSSMIALLAKEAYFPEDQAACSEPEAAMEMLQSVRSKGAGTAQGTRYKTSIIAVPISRREKEVLGALAMRFFSSSQSISEALDRNMDKMQATAAQIASLLNDTPH